ncbi:hypothetical protein [Cohnella terricola]|uniref:Uncharacterized protein n=1 Tax=Cohnella terricola TaxID=1289167 RepID=A0A559JFJ8_9BACL|nr:hypothetical protein [Cohnella terricola]TVX98645.1 hypothetical protein FPZ45_15165 [Cohnella terricola]
MLKFKLTDGKMLFVDGYAIAGGATGEVTETSELKALEKSRHKNSFYIEFSQIKSIHNMEESNSSDITIFTVADEKIEFEIDSAQEAQRFLSETESLFREKGFMTEKEAMPTKRAVMSPLKYMLVMAVLCGIITYVVYGFESGTLSSVRVPWWMAIFLWLGEAVGSFWVLICSILLVSIGVIWLFRRIANPPIETVIRK